MTLFLIPNTVGNVGEIRRTCKSIVFDGDDPDDVVRWLRSGD